MAINSVVSSLPDPAYVAALEAKIREFEARLERVELNVIEARR